MTKPRVLLTNPGSIPAEVDQRLQEAGLRQIFNPWPKSIDTKDKIDSSGDRCPRHKQYPPPSRSCLRRIG